VVLGLPDPDWGRALHAVVVGADPQNLPDVQSIRRFLRARLTSHKVPKTFEFLPSLGRTDTLKLNRRAMTEERIGACQS
jgi:bile acid-coenzyme A ligase